MNETEQEYYERYQKPYHEKHREKRNAYMNARIKKDMKERPIHYRNSRLKYRFGITLVDYDRMYQVQQGRCAICKRHASELSRALHVDHDHATGTVRGLLCFRCNTSLEMFERQGWADSARRYLKNKGGI